MLLSTELRTATADTWAAAVGHRFVDELWRGRLDEAALRTYFVQDNQFFDAFVALLGAAVAGADRTAGRVVLARQLGVVAGPENDFFARALDALSVGPADRTEPVLLPPTHGFLELMREAAASREYPHCLVVLLVAEWLYLDWATRPGAELPADPICREWIELHSGPDFTAWVKFLRGEFDRVGADLDAAGRAVVGELFTRAVRLEREFFEASYPPPR